MPRRTRRILIIGGVPVVAIVALVLLWNWDWFIPFVDARASAALGRPVTIGHLHVRFGRVTTVVADDVKVDNPAGFTADAPFAQVAHLTIAADVIAYVRHRQIVIPEIGLDQPKVLVLADAAGKNNYTFAMGGGDGASSASSGPGPQIGDLRITDGQAHVEIPRLKTKFDLAISTRNGASIVNGPGGTTSAPVKPLPVPPVPPDQAQAIASAAPNAAPGAPATAASTGVGGASVGGGDAGGTTRIGASAANADSGAAGPGAGAAAADGGNGTEKAANGLPIPPIPPDQRKSTTAIADARGPVPAAPADKAVAAAPASTTAAPSDATVAPQSQAAVAAADHDDAAAPHSDTAQIVVDAKGTYAGQPVTGRLIGGALLSLRNDAEPYPVDLAVANGPTHVTLIGTVSDPLHFRGTDLKLDFAGPDMSLLYPLTGVPIPKTPAYHITGRLNYADSRVRFENFAGTVGNSDLEGTITEDPGKERPDVTADLRSRRIDLADLGGFIGTEPGHSNEANASPQQRAQTAQAEASPRLLPQQPLNLPKIRAADIHLKYRGERIEGQSVPFDSLTVALDIDGGRIRLHPVSFGVGTGSISGDFDLAPGAHDTIDTKAAIRFQRVDVSRLMAATHAFGGAGAISGQATLNTTGNSVATMLGNGNGGIDLYMTGGNLSALLVDLSGFQFGNALLSALGVPTRAQVQCFVAQFSLTRGLLQTRALMLDTGEGIINGTGDINLRDEMIAYHLKTEAKHFSIGSLPAAINLSGTFKKPSIMPDIAALGIRGGIAAGLGFIAPPLALLPTIQFGADDANRCARLLTPAAAKK